MYYCTLEQLRAGLGYLEEENSEDSKLRDALDRAMEIIHHQTQRTFYPQRLTMKYNFPEIQKSNLFGIYSASQFVEAMNNLVATYGGMLKLENDLIELYSVRNGDGTFVPLDHILLEPANIYPKTKLQLTENETWKKLSKQSKQVIEITGLWCYHRQPETMWVDSKDKLIYDMNLEDINLYVKNTSGSDALHRTPRFQEGQVISIPNGSTAEFMEIQRVDRSNHILEVNRGIGGTSIQSHTADEKIFIFKPWQNIYTACLRLAKWWLRLSDTDIFDKTSSGNQLPATIPKDVLQLLPARRICL